MGDTPGISQVYLNANVETIRPEDNLTYEEHPGIPVKMKSGGSHMTEQILQLTLEIIYLLTGENYTMVKKTSGDHVTSHQCTSEDLHSPTLIPERNVKEVVKVINKIIELLTGEVGDVSTKLHHHNEDNCNGDPPLDCSGVRSLTTSEASNECSNIVDKESPSIKCKSQNNTMVEGANNGDLRVSSMAKKHTDTVGTLSGDYFNSHQGGPGATKGTQNERPSTCILVYDTNTLNSQVPVTMTDAAFDKQLTNFSGQRIYMNHSGAPKTLPSNSNGQQAGCQEEWNCVEYGKSFHCNSDLTKHQQMQKEKLCNSSKSSKTLCTSDDLIECEVEVAERFHNGKPQAENVEGGFDCGKSLDGISDRDRHQEKDAACLDCGKNFSYKSHLTQHQKTHSNEKLFLCSECGKCFSLKSALLRHQMIHTGEKPFACTICGKRFNQRSHYIRHQLSHSGKKPFACLDCGKSFIQKSDLVKHQTGHKGMKLSCPVCRKEFCSKMFLVKHQKSHGESKGTVCSECGKCFSQKSALVVHQRIHTGEKPFSCDDCGKFFNRKSLLVRHQRVHTGEKPFSCVECGKSFTRTTNLIIHQRTHSGEKPYSCPRCSKSFNSNATLLKHQKTHAEDSEVI